MKCILLLLSSCAVALTTLSCAGTTDESNSAINLFSAEETGAGEDSTDFSSSERSSPDTIDYASVNVPPSPEEARSGSIVLTYRTEKGIITLEVDANDEDVYIEMADSLEDEDEDGEVPLGNSGVWYGRVQGDEQRGYRSSDSKSSSSDSRKSESSDSRKSESSDTNKSESSESRRSESTSSSNIRNESVISGGRSDTTVNINRQEIVYDYGRRRKGDSTGYDEDDLINKVTSEIRVAQDQFYEGDYARALEHIETSLSLHETAEACALKGSILFMMNEPDSARISWQRALRINPDMPGVDNAIKLLKDRGSR